MPDYARYLIGVAVWLVVVGIFLAANHAGHRKPTPRVPLHARRRSPDRGIVPDQRTTDTQ